MNDAAARGRGIWRSLRTEQRVAFGASAGLFVSMLLPWYQYTVVTAGGPGQDRTINAFQVFDFTEAAVLLVAAGVLALLIARAEGGTFALPGRDGTFVFAGGVWAAILIFLRQLDKPDGPREAVVGVAWGIFLAFAAAMALAAAGWRMRQHQPAVDVSADADDVDELWGADHAPTRAQPRPEADRP